MFTGIVSDIGEIVAVEERGDKRFKIRSGYDLAGVASGASIACAGVCLTVTEKAPAERWFAVDVSAETLSKSTAGDWAVGRLLNLERALKLGDELGGHIVTGHVDAVGTVVAAEPVGDSTKVTIAAPRALGGYIAAKGSVAVDGCSLTVNTVDDTAETTRFTVNLIPHTKEWTTFDALAPGVKINLEIDVLARYVARLNEATAKA